MIKFEKPKNLNGYELRDELRQAGVEIGDEINTILVEGDGSLMLKIKEEDIEKAIQVVSNHNGTENAPQPTPAEKLAAAGLTVDELKAVLGIN